MDGVLVDNRDIHIKAFEMWCDEHHISLPKNFLVQYFGMGNEDIFRAVLNDPELELHTLERWGAQKEAIYRQIFAAEIAPLKGLIPLLDDLKARGIKIAVGSSGMLANVEFVLRACGIERYFDALAHGDLISKAKPDPEVFLLAAKLLGLKPEECFVFEDSFAGVEAARRAGMPVGVLATTFDRSQHTDFDHLVDDFSQITADQILA